MASMTATATIPSEVRGWNWGAFFLGWVWGIGNNVWKSFLLFVPIFNLVFIFILGARGSEWAWQSKSWSSVDHFRKVQKAWAVWGLVIFVASMLIPVLMMGLGLMAGAPQMTAVGN
jgi:hypothetical protein